MSVKYFTPLGPKRINLALSEPKIYFVVSPIKVGKGGIEEGKLSVLNMHGFEMLLWQGEYTHTHTNIYLLMYEYLLCIL